MSEEELLSSLRSTDSKAHARLRQCAAEHIEALREKIATLTALVEPLGGGCDANLGGAHSAMGNPPFCADCGLMLKRVAYVLPHVSAAAVRAAMAGNNGQLTDSSTKPSVLSKGRCDAGAGSVAAGNGTGGEAGGSDG